MLNILLVRPPYKGMGKYIPPHMGLCSIAAYLRKNLKCDANFKFIDALPDKMDVLDIVENVVESKPDIVLMTVKTLQKNVSLEIAKEVKKRSETIVVLGGNHVTVKPEEMISDNSVDYCVVGEGERPILKLINHLFLYKGKIEDIDGLYYKRNGHICKNVFLKYLDINELPCPAWDLLDLSKYTENIHVNIIDQALPIMASRGCPFSCDFCSTYLTWGHKVRYRSPQNVISEIKECIEKYKIRTFHFYDDNLLLNSKWIHEFVELLLGENLNIEWICLSRPEIILREKEFLPKMKLAGCRGFELGFEAGDDELYSNMNKGVKYSNFINSFKLIESCGFDMIELLLMNFYDGETVFSLWKAGKEVEELKKSNAYILTSRYHATPFPGTEFFNKCIKKGILIDETFDYFHAQYMTYMPNSFLDSSMKGFHFQIINMCMGFEFYFTEYFLINKNIILDLLKGNEFKKYVTALNNFGQIKPTVKEVSYAVREWMLWDISDQILYEIIGKTFILALDTKGLVYFES